jgi:ATP-binding cassette subfamily B protein
LASIAKHYKLNIPIARIREIAGTDRQGTNVLGIVKAAEQLGFTAKGVRGDRRALFSKFPLPAIAHIVTERNTLHFVVVYKITRDKIIVADPAKGILEYTPSNFFRLWSGVLVVIAPNTSFKTGDMSQTTLVKFFNLLIPQRGLLFNIFLTSLLVTGLGILSSFYFQMLMDNVLPNQLEGTLIVVSIGVVALHLFQIVLSFFRSYLLTFLSQRLNINLIFAYYRHVLRLPLTFFSTRRVGEIVSRFSDADRVRNSISSATLTVVFDTLMTIGGGIVLFRQSPKLFLMTILIAALEGGIVYAFMGPMRKANIKLMEEGADLNSFMVESLNGVENIKAYNSEEKAIAKSENLFIKLVRTQFSTTKMTNVQGGLASMISSIGGTAILWVASSAVLDGSMSIGEMLTFNALMSAFISPLMNLINLQPAMQSAVVAANRLGEILDLSEEKKEDEDRKSAPDMHGGIEIRGLEFAYGTRAPVLRDLNISVPPGSKIAFVGESGSGKTTMAKLIMRFYSIEKGEISISGYNINDINIDHLRSHIAYISQQVFIFSGTILENLRFSAGDLPMEEIIDACRKARAHEFINELPLRYDTRLEENGANLSGGQRQRLSIAQALLKKPDIIIMDEATSNLDTITEKAIERMIYNETRNITVIMIAHRLSTIMNCDYVYVFDKGRILEHGTHNWLMAQRGQYFNLWKDQIPANVGGMDDYTNPGGQPMVYSEPLYNSHDHGNLESSRYNSGSFQHAQPDYEQPSYDYSRTHPGQIYIPPEYQRQYTHPGYNYPGSG